ncbi:MAG: hypothetical protein ACK4MX_02785 [Thermaurantiacus sp.]
MGSGAGAAETTPPALLGFIDAAIAEGRDAQAQQLLENARALAGDPPELRVRAAELQMVADPQAARAALSALLDTEVKAYAHVLLAHIALSEGNAALAATEADRAIAIDGANARAWMVRGVAADRERDWKMAAHSHDTAVSLAPDSASARNNRGYSRLLRKQYADAQADLEVAAALSPDSPRIRRNLQLAIALQGRYAEALGKGRPEERARDYNLLGFAAMARGDDAIAAAYFSRARDAGGEASAIADANLAALAAGQRSRSR